MPVQIIKAIPQYSNVPDAPPKKLRCAYYARISLDEDGTSTSIAGQKAYFEDYIKNNPEYIFSGAYYDDGISGTSTRKRHGFTQMMRDVEENKLDVILVKSISRWGRNIVLTLSSLRLCAEHNCRVFFFKEGLWSDDPATNLILTIMSSMAEAESASISGNVALGIRFKFQQGKPMINCSRFLGYDKDPISKKLVINPFEARIVRFIYRAFLEGFSIPEIAKKLRENHIPSGSGRTDWPTESIKYILSNEKYVGDLLMQKTYCKSFLTHRMVKNEGKLPQYFVQDNHDPVIPREVFNLVQRELISRGRCEGHPGQRKYPLSGKVICGCCGTEYKRFAGARVSTALPTPPAADHGTTLAANGVDSGAANTLPALPAVLPPAVDTRNVETSSVDTAASGDVENRAAGAVWKCKARVSRKDAAAAAARLFSTTTNPSSATPAADQASTPGSVATSTAGDGETIPTPSRDGLIWRCDNKIIGEEQLVMAVDRALALLPREEANIRLIQQECLRVLALPTPANATPSSPSAACAEHSGEGDDRHTAAQILLLHTETALRWLHSSGNNEAGRDGGWADALPCTTFQQFVERSSVWLGSDTDAIDLLVEKVVIDGDQIKVRFKAGVEI